MFKTPVLKRMLNLCQTGSKNATTRTFFNAVLSPTRRCNLAAEKEESGRESYIIKSAGIFFKTTNTSNLSPL